MGRRKINLIFVQGNLSDQGYINQILQPEAVPFPLHGPAMLMHDNKRHHVARICRQFLNRNNVNVLPWPSVSPDMNTFEHIWDYLGRKVPNTWTLSIIGNGKSPKTKCTLFFLEPSVFLHIFKRSEVLLMSAFKLFVYILVSFQKREVIIIAL